MREGIAERRKKKKKDEDCEKFINRTRRMARGTKRCWEKEKLPKEVCNNPCSLARHPDVVRIPVSSLFLALQLEFARRELWSRGRPLFVQSDDDAGRCEGGKKSKKKIDQELLSNLSFCSAVGRGQGG